MPETRRRPHTVLSPQEEQAFLTWLYAQWGNWEQGGHIQHLAIYLQGYGEAQRLTTLKKLRAHLRTTKPAWNRRCWLETVEHAMAVWRTGHNGHNGHNGHHCEGEAHADL